MSIVLVTNPKFNYFLCSMFNGMIYAFEKGLHQDEQLKKDCETNFRRLYKLLNEDDKKSIHAELEGIKEDPEKQGNVVHDLIELAVEKLKE